MITLPASWKTRWTQDFVRNHMPVQTWYRSGRFYYRGLQSLMPTRTSRRWKRCWMSTGRRRPGQKHQRPRPPYHPVPPLLLHRASRPPNRPPRPNLRPLRNPTPPRPSLQLLPNPPVRNPRARNPAPPEPPQPRLNRPNPHNRCTPDVVRYLAMRSAPLRSAVATTGGVAPPRTIAAKPPQPRLNRPNPHNRCTPDVVRYLAMRSAPLPSAAAATDGVAPPRPIAAKIPTVILVAGVEAPL